MALVRMTKVRTFLGALFAAIVLALFAAFVARSLGYSIPGLGAGGVAGM